MAPDGIRKAPWLASTPGPPTDHLQAASCSSSRPDVRNRKGDHVKVVLIFSTGNLGPTRLVIPVEGSGLRYNRVLFC
jgi:hypothetical protein